MCNQSCMKQSPPKSSGSLLGSDSPWTCWCNKLYSTVVNVLQGVFCDSGFYNTCKVLAVASWSTYSFLETDKAVSYSHNSSRIFHRLLWSTELKTLVHTKAFVQSMKQEMFLWISPAFSMIQQMLAIWSLVPLPFLNIACASGNSQFTYCWSRAWRILNITLLVCEMSKIVW